MIFCLHGLLAARPVAPAACRRQSQSHAGQLALRRGRPACMAQVRRASEFAGAILFRPASAKRQSNGSYRISHDIQDQVL